jgi:hypothetical protein
MIVKNGFDITDSPCIFKVDKDGINQILTISVNEGFITIRLNSEQLYNLSKELTDSVKEGIEFSLDIEKLQPIKKVK